MNKVIAIPAEKLGLLEQQFIGLISPVLKRKRQVRFNGLVQVLKALGLIRMKSEVVALSYGIEANGALVFVEHAPHADAVPILAPGPVGIVVELARNLVCDHLNRILAGIGPPPRVHWLPENHPNGIGQLRFLGLSEENCVKYCRWWLRNSR